MEERSQIQINQCFRFDPASRAAFCRIRNGDIVCRQKIAQNHHGNKMRHLEKFHPNIFKELKKNKKKKKVQNTVKSVRVKINIRTIYSAFVELVSKNGRPFCITEDSGMRIIIDPILEGVL